MKKFWIKFSLFLLFSLIIPISFIVFRFKLFSTSKQIHIITLWAIIALCILVLVVSFLIKIYLDGMKTKYSLLKQILQGFLKVILPLGLILVFAIFSRYLIVSMKDHYEKMLESANKLIQTLVVCIGCEIIAIVVNPLPKWSFDNNVEGMAEIYDKIKNKGGTETE